MLHFDLTKHQYIIDVDNHELPMEWCENLIHEPLKRARGNREAKWHDQSLKSHLTLECVFHSSPSQIRILYYPLLKSILEKKVDPWISSSMYLSLGMGCLNLIVIFLIAWLSIHILIEPSFLGTRRAGTAHGLKVSHTNHLAMSSFTCLCISMVSLRFIL